MILELLGLAGLGWLGSHVLGEDVLVGYKCKFCDWRTDRYDPRTFEYDQDAQEDAMRLFKLHLEDAHPAVYRKMFPEETSNAQAP